MNTDNVLLCTSIIPIRLCNVPYATSQDINHNMSCMEIHRKSKNSTILNGSWKRKAHVSPRTTQSSTILYWHLLQYCNCFLHVKVNKQHRRKCVCTLPSYLLEQDFGDVHLRRIKQNIQEINGSIWFQINSRRNRYINISTIFWFNNFLLQVQFEKYCAVKALTTSSLLAKAMNTEHLQGCCEFMNYRNKKYAFFW